jgi:TPR repeat protein
MTTKNIIFATLLSFSLSAVSSWESGVENYKNGKFDLAYAEWLTLADEGSARAQYNVGVLLFDGTGVDKNKNLAWEYFSKSADQGHAEANYNLGIISGGMFGPIKAKIFEIYSSFSESPSSDNNKHKEPCDKSSKS